MQMHFFEARQKPNSLSSRASPAGLASSPCTTFQVFLFREPILPRIASPSSVPCTTFRSFVSRSLPSSDALFSVSFALHFSSRPFLGSRFAIDNDPSAGSPTETLLRLLLPLSARVRSPFRPAPTRGPRKPAQVRRSIDRTTSLERSIGSSDGRCVQRAGTQSARDDDSRLLGIPGSRETLSSLCPDYDRVSFDFTSLSARGPSRGEPKPARKTGDDAPFRSSCCSDHCSTRAAPNIEGHHRPVIARSRAA